MRIAAIYDNSEKNRNNPNRPPEPVRWGEETTDEAGIEFVACTLDGGNPERGMPETFFSAVGGALVRRGRILLVQRAENRRWLPGCWELPGGRAQAGERLE